MKRIFELAVLYLVLASANTLLFVLLSVTFPKLCGFSFVVSCVVNMLFIDLIHEFYKMGRTGNKAELRLEKFHFDFVDISSTYITFVLLHRWNKVDRRGFEFLDGSKWDAGSKIKKRLYNKIKKLNENTFNEDY